MKLMKPLPSEHIPAGDNWVYEIKYDGFRCVLEWNQDSITLTSRNNKDLTEKFPEIITFCNQFHSDAAPFLPLKLDGELAVLNNAYQANFPLIQKRGRLKSAASIQKNAETRPAVFLAFDLIEQNGKKADSSSYSERRKKLQSFMNKLSLRQKYDQPLAFVETYQEIKKIKEVVSNYKAEGMIAKRATSGYLPEKNHHDWFKIKNWRTILGILTSFNQANGYFTVQVYKENNELLEIGKCKHGLDQESETALKQLFRTEGVKHGEVYTLPPAICARIHTLDLYHAELREPEFDALAPGTSVKDVTDRRLKIDLAMLPDQIKVTNSDKVYWPETSLSKGDLLIYLREISTYMLPFLRERALTVIRSPDGVTEEYFFQKNLPSHAPDFIESMLIGGEHKMMCNSLEALLWFANHGAIEYHIPFQKIGRAKPAEIVFDLDPPCREDFAAAIQAALLIKQLLDDLDLLSFVKTSGNKGIQIHIPIKEGSMSYDETAVFTQAVALTLEAEYPALFTTERLKSKRNEKLYIDYIQHAKDKTIIAAYSPRKTLDATVATPLFWEEVKEGLNPGMFTIENVLDRVQTYGCPFTGYFAAGQTQKLDKVLQLVKG